MRLHRLLFALLLVVAVLLLLLLLLEHETIEPTPDSTLAHTTQGTTKEMPRLSV
jgi:hypothetical protein